MPYFDYNATTPPHPAAMAAGNALAAEAWHNPSSPYRAAARAHALMEEARERLAALLGGQPEDYVFTSGATEANNAVLQFAAQHAPENACAAVSAIEHPSILEAARAAFGKHTVLLPCTVDGITQLDALAEVLEKSRVAIVSVMAANNETGVLQPWAEARALAQAKGVPFHCDAAQWLGKLPPDSLAECDYVTGCAHKFGGPKGVGFLKVPAGDWAFRGQRGGEQEHGRRAGTENLPAIGAMVAALEAVTPRLAQETARWQSSRDSFAAELPGALPGAIMLGGSVQRLWNTVMLIAPRHENTRWVAALDRRGFQVSTGSACATGHAGPSHVLAAMGMGPEAARRALRVSAGWDTTAAEWEALLTAMGESLAALDATA
jgi:cysteine desulfurase